MCYKNCGIQTNQRAIFTRVSHCRTNTWYGLVYSTKVQCQIIIHHIFRHLLLQYMTSQYNVQSLVVGQPNEYTNNINLTQLLCTPVGLTWIELCVQSIRLLHLYIWKLGSHTMQYEALGFMFKVQCQIIILSIKITIGLHLQMFIYYSIRIPKETPFNSLQSCSAFT